MSTIDSLDDLWNDLEDCKHPDSMPGPSAAELAAHRLGWRATDGDGTWVRYWCLQNTAWVWLPCIVDGDKNADCVWVTYYFRKGRSKAVWARREWRTTQGLVPRFGKPRDREALERAAVRVPPQYPPRKKS